MQLLVFSLIPALALLFYGVLLGIALWRRDEHPALRNFALYLLIMVVWSLGALMMYLDRDHALEWNRVLVIGNASMPFAFVGFARSLRQTRSHWGVLLFAASYWLLTVVLVLAGRMVTSASVTDTGQIAFTMTDLIILPALSFLVCSGISARELALGHRAARGFTERNRLRYVVVGLAFIVIGAMTNLVPSLSKYPFDIAANVVNALLITAAIYRYQLLDIRIVVRKGILYLVPTTIISASYLLMVYIGASFLHLAGMSQLVFSMTVALLMAIGLQPLRDLAQVWVDRIFFRQKFSAALMIGRLSRSAASILDTHQLAALLLREITDTMLIAHAFLLLRDQQKGAFVLAGQKGFSAGTFARVRRGSPIAEWLARRGQVLTHQEIMSHPQFKALWGDERSELEQAHIELFVPLLVGADLVGILALGPKLSDATYGPDEELTLITLANQTAIAVANSTLYRTAVDERDRAETILRNAFAGIIVLDAHHHVVTMNPAAEGITGYSAAELRNQRVEPIIDLDAWTESAARLSRSSTSQGDPVEMVLRGKNGVRDVLLGVTPQGDGFVVNFADITHLKEVDRLKSEIVANVSHELRAPLASIKGYAELLLDWSEGDGEELRQRFLTIINDETDRLADFINELLDLSRLESGRVELHMTVGVLSTLVADVVISLDVLARRAGVALQFEAPSDLPLVLHNREWLHSAIRNLVVNAIKFSPRGGVVEIRTYAGEHEQFLQVVDHGVGISSEELPHLFTKFYRGSDDRRGQVRGTGLGLVIAKEVVALHQGTITVESGLGRGTCFTIALPTATLETPSQVIYWGPVLREGKRQ